MQVSQRQKSVKAPVSAPGIPSFPKRNGNTKETNSAHLKEATDASQGLQVNQVHLACNENITNSVIYSLKSMSSQDVTEGLDNS